MTYKINESCGVTQDVAQDIKVKLDVLTKENIMSQEIIKSFP